MPAEAASAAVDGTSLATGPAHDGVATEQPSKAARTRATILETALRLFRERGYDDTTMRAIAAEAGVSVGNAYYYFASKEHLIQAFYDQAYELHEVAARPILATETDLNARIIGVIDVWLDAMEPYRGFAGSFFKNAAEPASPLSPFSPESAPARDASIGLWREVLEGSTTDVPGALREDLPALLWVFFMGIVLYWVHDRSPNAARSRLLARRIVPLVVLAISFADQPFLQDAVADVVTLIGELRDL